MELPGIRRVGASIAVGGSLLFVLAFAGEASARNVYVSNSIGGGVAYFPIPAGTPATVGDSTFSAIGPAVSIGFTPDGAQGYAVQGGGAGGNAVARFDPAT